MRVAVMRLSGAAFDVQAFVARFGLVPDRLWQAGTPDHRGRPHSASGCNLTIADVTSSEALLRDVFAWLETHRSALLAVPGLGGTAVLDFGLTVGSADEFTATLTLPSALVARLADVGVAVALSAYPASESIET